MNPITRDGKWVIVDTNVIINIQILKSEVPIFQPVFDEIGVFTPAITPLIRTEYLRKSKSKGEYEVFKKHLDDNYAEINLRDPNNKYDIFNWAGECAVVCGYATDKNKHNKHIELTDYVNHALMRRYYENLYILTFDNHDFPTPIFDVVCHHSVNINGQLMVWSLRKFNRDEFSKCFEHYKNAQPNSRR